MLSHDKIDGMNDTVSRFLMESTDVRGNVVHLHHTIKDALRHHDYPPVLRQSLCELMAASALITSTLKLAEGSITFQVQGSGALNLLIVECGADMRMRATAKWQGDIEKMSFKEMIGQGTFVITLNLSGGQSYQGIVELRGDSISSILETYMQQSAQIETRIWLASDMQSAAGLLLQKMPDIHGFDEDVWQRSTTLADTVTKDEMLQLSSEDLLHRLFHQEDIRLLPHSVITFYCRCSRDSVGNMLKLLGREEVDSILHEQGRVKVNCDFCNAAYEFDAVDAEQLFMGEYLGEPSKLKH